MGADHFDFAPAFAKRSIKPRSPVYDPAELPTKVSVDLRASRTHALLDVQTADYPGLLYRIACAIADAGLDISSARIATEKGAALDTFYLCDQHGKKIEDEDILASLIESVRQRITTP